MLRIISGRSDSPLAYQRDRRLSKPPVRRRLLAASDRPQREDARRLPLIRAVQAISRTITQEEEREKEEERGGERESEVVFQENVRDDVTN
jgi:hypothetical protein